MNSNSKTISVEEDLELSEMELMSLTNRILELESKLSSAEEFEKKNVDGFWYRFFRIKIKHYQDKQTIFKRVLALENRINNI